MRKTVIVPLLLAFLSCLSGSDKSEGRIAFQSCESGRQSCAIRSAEPDGTEPRRISGESDTWLQFAWSRDAKRIAYVEDNSLHIVNADGTDDTTFRGTPDGIFYISWSPDGERLVFVSPVGTTDIYTIRSDGSDLQKITDSQCERFSCYRYPTWSPDSQRLAFSDGEDIYTINSDGTGLAQITSSPDFEDVPSWSPDGEYIAFVAASESSSSIPGDIFVQGDLYVMKADGSDQRRLTTDFSITEPLRPWSPDGDHLAFYSTHRNSEIYVVSTDGTELTNLTDNPAFDFDLSWSPDGSRIAFISGRDGESEVYVMAADGSNVIRVTNDENEDRFTAWSPK